MRLYLQFFLLLFIALFYASCESNRWNQDVSQIEYDPEIKRFELDFFDKGNDGFTIDEMNQLEQAYPIMLPLYLNGVLNFNAINTEETRSNLSALANNKDIQTLYNDVKKKYPERALNQELQAIKEALKLYSYYFPETELPELYTLISMFSYNVVVDEKVLGISLDMYLGGDYKYYPSTNIPKYRFKNFTSEFIVCDAIKAFLIAEFDKEVGMNLLEQMVFYGKIAYLQEALLPEQEPRTYFNYDESELEWCEVNESEIWFHLVDMELLYTTETEKVRKYIDDAPFIPGFPEGSTAKVGKWLGYKIVRSYMENNKEIGLDELMKNQDANHILLKSKYKPKR